ncbi:hypothetical protein [Parasphingorhabdus sp.]|uniref:hypothetical protein n=1 Tax=Parasphingorhabdus sp. TaxID=2709688 RepID=UPI003A91B212
MIAFRRLFRAYPCLLALVCFAALAMKILVPPGYMVNQDTKTFTVKICNGIGNAETTIEIPFGPKTAGKEKHDGAGDPSGTTCSFAGFSQLVATGADPIQLVLAILFILLAGLQLLQMPLPGVADRLRPPLRGPPVIA